MPVHALSVLISQTLQAVASGMRLLQRALYVGTTVSVCPNNIFIDGLFVEAPTAYLEEIVE